MVGTVLISFNLLFLGVLGVFEGSASGLLPWPEGLGPEGLVVEPDALFRSEASSIAVVRERAPGLAQEVRSEAYPPATWIWIPSIEVDSPVVEIGIKEERGVLVWETAKWAAGHHGGTANPGQRSNIVLSGHIRSITRNEGNVFNRLPELDLGDSVVLYTDEGEHRYRVVDWRIVTPYQIDVMAPTPGEQLTLITCYPDWIFTHRLVVTAVPE